MTTFAAFGDSITATYHSFDYINNASETALAADNIRSWVYYATGNELQYVGGFARGGYKSTAIAAATSPVLCDVGVVMAGTNDIGPAPWGVPLQDSLNAVRDVVVASRVPRAVVSAVAPRNGQEAARTLQFNADLRSYVTGMGWVWCDPWVTVRASSGEWAHSSLTYDGIHPVWQSAQRAGQKLAECLARICPSTPPPV